MRPTRPLPLPSIVEVTNLDNGKKLRVRVNDRGPFVDNRIIDLQPRGRPGAGLRPQGPGQGMRVGDTSAPGACWPVPEAACGALSAKPSSGPMRSSSPPSVASSMPVAVALGRVDPSRVARAAGRGQGDAAPLPALTWPGAGRSGRCDSFLRHAGRPDLPYPGWIIQR